MVICVDIGGTSSKAGLLDSSGQLHSVSSVPTRPPVETYFDSLVQIIDRCRLAAEAQGNTCKGMGVAVAGFLTPSKDRLIYNSNLSWLEGFPLRDRLAAHFLLPIELETDSNSACMAEFRFGCGSTSKRFLCVTVGTGVGVGLTVNGEPLRFSYGCLGDMGHVIVQPHGPVCSCGGAGVQKPYYLLRPWRFVMQSALVSTRKLACETLSKLPPQQTKLPLKFCATPGIGWGWRSLRWPISCSRIKLQLRAGSLPVATRLETAERVFRNSASIMARENVAFSKATLGPSATLIGAAWPFWQAL